MGHHFIKKSRTSRPICYVFVECRQVNGSPYSTMKIGLYSRSSQTCADILEICLGERENIGTLVHQNKIYVLGGRKHDVSLNTVSTISKATSEIAMFKFTPRFKLRAGVRLRSENRPKRNFAANEYRSRIARIGLVRKPDLCVWWTQRL